MDRKIKSNKIITRGSIGVLSLMLGITSLTGCTKSKSNDYFEEMAYIYSYDNTYLSDENKEKYLFSREKVRVFDCEKLGVVIIVKDDVDDYGYIVPETEAANHWCFLHSDHITIVLSDGAFKQYGNYLPLENFLNEDEKEKDKFYIEELVEIQNRVNNEKSMLIRK